MRPLVSTLLVGLGACSSSGPVPPPDRDAPISATTPSEEVAEPWEATLRQIEANLRDGQDQEDLERASVELERLVEEHPQALPIRIRLAEVHYYRGAAFPDSGEPADAFEAGVGQAEAALQRVPEWTAQLRAGRSIEGLLADRNLAIPSDALYWYCRNLLAFAREGGLATLLFYKDRIAAGFHRLELDAARFDGGGPHRGQGVLRAVLPEYSGRDLDASKRHFEAAGGLDASPWNNVAEAESWAREVGQADRARSLLEAVLQAAADRGRDAWAQRRARWLLEGGEPIGRKATAP